MSLFDPGERRAAARLQHGNPGWLILWGVHSRLYGRFPCLTPHGEPSCPLLGHGS